MKFFFKPDIFEIEICKHFPILKTSYYKVEKKGYHKSEF